MQNHRRNLAAGGCETGRVQRSVRAVSWEIPELCYGEINPSAEHTAMLEAQGFRVTQNVAGIPTRRDG